MRIKEAFLDSIALKTRVLEDEKFMQLIDDISTVCIKSLNNEGKILFCGNGGSAADAQHLAAELTGRYYYDRPPLNAEALHVDTSFLTAVANDYSFDEIFARMVKAKAKKGDILIGLSTSGNSENVVKAFETAKEMGVITIAFTGKTGGKLINLSNYLFNIPSTDTPRIQEVHMLLGHILCEQIESNIFPQ